MCDGVAAQRGGAVEALEGRPDARERRRQVRRKPDVVVPDDREVGARPQPPAYGRGEHADGEIVVRGEDGGGRDRVGVEEPGAGIAVDPTGGEARSVHDRDIAMPEVDEMTDRPLLTEALPPQAPGPPFRSAPSSQLGHPLQPEGGGVPQRMVEGQVDHTR